MDENVDILAVLGIVPAPQEGGSMMKSKPLPVEGGVPIVGTRRKEPEIDPEVAEYVATRTDESREETRKRIDFIRNLMICSLPREDILDKFSRAFANPQGKPMCRSMAERYWRAARQMQNMILDQTPEDALSDGITFWTRRLQHVIQLAQHADSTLIDMEQIQQQIWGQISKLERRLVSLLSLEDGDKQNYAREINNAKGKLAEMRMVYEDYSGYIDKQRIHASFLRNETAKYRGYIDRLTIRVTAPNEEPASAKLIDSMAATPEPITFEEVKDEVKRLMEDPELQELLSESDLVD